jgi:hypothetical protein
MANGTRKAPRGWLIAGVVCLLVGIGGCGAAVAGVAALVDVVNDSSGQTAFGSTVGFTSSADSTAVVLLTDDVPCEAVDDANRAVVVEEFADEVTIDTDAASFRTIRTFDTREGDRYDVTCGSEGDQGTFVVAELPGILTGVTGALVFGAGILGGALFLLLGVIFIVIGLVQRSRWKKQQGPGASPFGGGGYPPPPGSGAGGYGAPPPPGGSTPPPMTYGTPPDHSQQPGQPQQPPGFAQPPPSYPPPSYPPQNPAPAAPPPPRYPPGPSSDPSDRGGASPAPPEWPSPPSPPPARPG